MTVNPLIAGRVDIPVSAWSGVWIAEDIELITQGIRNGNWIDTTLGTVSAGLDALAFITDPVGVLLQYGVAWIVEHVKPLSQALDWLAGDPGQIAGHSQTWRNVATSMGTQAERLNTAVRLDVTGWTGTASNAYRAWANEQQHALGALGRAANTMAAITEGAGYLIAGVRMLVRDAIATCVSRLIVYAAEEALSFGFATPLVVTQVTTLIASWAAKIARWLKALISSLRQLIPVVRRLASHIDELKKILTRLQRSGPQPEAPRSDGPRPNNFTPAVIAPDKLFQDKERAIADRLVEEGEMVHPRERVDGIHGQKNPDAIVRSGPDDPGVITEFKTLDSGDSSSVRRNILSAGKQVDQEGGGNLVIDGRAIGLTEEAARRGYARAIGQSRTHGSPLPDQVRIILGDDRIITLPD